MNDSPIIILDEPTTGLDPLMRDAFLEIIKAEHKKGKTIFMSSHMFEEMEQTCDRVAMISDGHIVDIADMNAIRNRKENDFKIEFNNEADYKKFQGMGYKILRLQDQYNQVTVEVLDDDINDLFKSLKGLDVKFISEVKYTLEKYFKDKMKDKEGE